MSDEVVAALNELISRFELEMEAATVIAQQTENTQHVLQAFHHAVRMTKRMRDEYADSE